MINVRRIHWFGPGSMLAALLVGACFALGHHFFYDTLNGKEVPSGSYSVSKRSSGITRQEINIAIGTAFAFAVKACLAFAVSTAYVQLFWRALIAPSPTKAYTLKSIDKAYSVLHNATLLADLSCWIRFPLLLVLALAAWLIPLASIITPATLSVEPRAMVPPPINSRYVPIVNFDTLSYQTRFHQIAPGGYSYFYGGPSQALKRVVSAVSAQGAILPIDPPSANATWSLHFHGPTIRCDSPPVAEQVDIRQNIADFMTANIPWKAGSLPWEAYTTWFGELPYMKSGLFQNGTLAPRNVTRLRSDVYPTNATFRLAVLPQVIPLTEMALALPDERRYELDGLLETYNASAATSNATVLQCELFNSTYSVGFTYVNGNQTVNVNAPSSADTQPFGPAISYIFGPVNDTCAGLRPVYPDMNTTAEDELRKICDFDPETPRRFAYQAMLDAFFGAVSGPIASQQFTVGNVANTVLLESDELCLLSDYTLATQPDSQFLQSSLLQLGFSEVVGLATPGPNQDRLPLDRMLEQLFQNFTVSLMSSPYFQPNLSSPTTLPQTPVSSETYRNVYTYSLRRLGIAYGLAIAIATLAVATGLQVMLASGSSYSNDFSSILRVSRHAKLDREVEPCDADGIQPLPKYLAITTVRFPGGGGGHGESGPARVRGDETSSGLLRPAGEDGGERSTM